MEPVIRALRDESHGSFIHPCSEKEATQSLRSRGVVFGVVSDRGDRT